MKRFCGGGEAAQLGGGNEGSQLRDPGSSGQPGASGGDSSMLHDLQ